MAELFFISDTHFGHKGILTFEDKDGKPVRNFIDIIEMHTVMIENWNRVVTPKDKIYHLGDVAFSKAGLQLLALLNGKKRLIRGNHDLYKTRLYMEHFQEIYGVRQINNYWLTHVPMHPDCVNTKRVIANIHGHLHTNVIDDPRWINVSVEQIDYTPISFDEIKERVE